MSALDSLRASWLAAIWASLQAPDDFVLWLAAKDSWDAYSAALVTP